MLSALESLSHPTYNRNPAAIQDVAAFPPPSFPHPVRPHALSTLPLRPFSDLFPLFHFFVPEFRPILLTEAVPTACPLVSGPPPIGPATRPRTARTGSLHSQPDTLQWPSSPLPRPPTAPPNNVPAPGPTHTCCRIWARLPLHFLFLLCPTCTANSHHIKAPSCVIPLHFYLCTCASLGLECPF